MGFGIKLIDGISQANNQTFKMVKGKDVDMTEVSATLDNSSIHADDLFLIDDVSQGGSGGGTQASTKNITAGSLKDWITASITLLELGTTSTTALAGDTTTISSAQANAITANTAKTGITTTQANAITANTAKTGITTTQANAITANTAKVGFTDALVVGNAAVTANTAKNTNVTTDLSVTANGTSLTVNSSDGTDVSLPAATTDAWGVMTDEMFDNNTTAYTHSQSAHAPSNAEANTASNLGTGSEVFKAKSGVDLQFRKLTAGSNVTITENTNDITIASTGGGGGASAMDDLSDADTTTDTPGLNEVLKWNGLNWVPAPYDYSFEWSFDQVFWNSSGEGDVIDTTPSSNNYGTYSTILVGTGNHSTSIGVTLDFSNIVAADFTSGANGSDNKGLQTKPYGQSTYTDRANLSLSGGQATASYTIDYPYPTGAMTGGKYAYGKVQFIYDGTSYTQTIRWSYQNQIYLGKHTDDSPTSTELQAFPRKIFAVNGSSTYQDIAAYGIPLTSTSQHLQLWYPDRINTTPSFEVGSSSTSLNGETWTAINGTISFTNENGYTEDYKGLKSPNPLSNAGGVNTWYVKVTF